MATPRGANHVLPQSIDALRGQTKDGRAVPASRGTAVSTAIMIAMNNFSIGSIQQFNPTQRRPVERVYQLPTDLGWDAGRNISAGEPVDMVPGLTSGSINVTRFALYRSRLFEAMGFDVASIEDLIEPFEILVFQRNPLTGGFDSEFTLDSSNVVEKFMDCYVSQHTSNTAPTGNLIIVETAVIEYRRRIRGQGARTA